MLPLQGRVWRMAKLQIDAHDATRWVHTQQRESAQAYRDRGVSYSRKTLLEDSDPALPQCSVGCLNISSERRGKRKPRWFQRGHEVRRVP